MRIGLGLGITNGGAPAGSFADWIQVQSGHLAWFDIVNQPPVVNGSGWVETWTSVCGNFVLEPDGGAAKSQIVLETDPDGDGFDCVRTERGHSLHLQGGHPTIDIDADGDAYNIVVVGRANSANIDGFSSLYAAANAPSADGATLRMSGFTTAAFQIYDDAQALRGNRSVTPIPDMNIAGNWNLMIGRHYYDGNGHSIQVTGGGEDGSGRTGVTSSTFTNFDQFLVGGFGAEDTTGACRVRAIGVLHWPGNVGDMFDTFEYDMGANGQGFASELDDRLLAIFNNTHTGLSANARA